MFLTTFWWNIILYKNHFKTFCCSATNYYLIVTLVTASNIDCLKLLFIIVQWCITWLWLVTASNSDIFVIMISIVKYYLIVTLVTTSNIDLSKMFFWYYNGILLDWSSSNILKYWPLHNSVCDRTIKNYLTVTLATSEIGRWDLS